MESEITKEELLELYKLLEKKLLEKKEKFKKKRFKDDELIQLLLETILMQERKTQVGIIKYIDLENIDFKDQNIMFINLQETNANINPQTILDKNLQNTKLCGDFKDKSFDDVYICGTDFTNTTNVTINPQKIKGKKINNAKVDGVDFNNESFDGIEHIGTDFTNAINCVLNKKLFYKYKKIISQI